MHSILPDEKLKKIEEAKFGIRHCNRGRRVKGKSEVGGVQRKSGNSCLVAVKRNGELLNPKR